MGGDFGPPVVVPAALHVLANHKDLHLILVGDKESLEQHLTISQDLNRDPSRLTIHHSTQKVEMDELPSSALRTKKDSSMRVAINLVKEGKAAACVSAGNTGALMATARFVLKTIPGIDRPAIVCAFPTATNQNKVRMLDLGANVDSTAEHLFQFAVMGSVLASLLDNIKDPKVYLLNIGKEDVKGNEQVKETAQLLINSRILNYQGYIEGDELYKGEADVIVCDGFVGNIALKTSEGVIRLLSKLVKEAFKRHFFTRLVGLFSLSILKKLGKRFDPNLYNGATFIGLQGIVIKSHGGANTDAFANAIEEAIIQVDKNIPEHISAEVERILTLSKNENLNT